MSTYGIKMNITEERTKCDNRVAKHSEEKRGGEQVKLH